MDITIYYCKECFNELREFGSPCVAMFETICEHYCRYCEPYIIDDDVHAYDHGMLQVIDFLEDKGFILTTEASLTEIAIIPYDIEWDGDRFFICTC